MGNTSSSPSLAQTATLATTVTTPTRQAAAAATEGSSSGTQSDPIRRRSIQSSPTPLSPLSPSTSPSPPPSASSSIATTVATRGPTLRKHAARVAQLERDEDLDSEPTGGTLRGAMLGKADHVVYGPRRIDGIAPSPQILSAAVSPSPRPSKPISVTALPSKLGSGAIDPDDTTHPLYRASSRLTSQVRSTMDEMPVILSPVDSAPLHSFHTAPTTSSADMDALSPRSDSPFPPTQTSTDTIIPSLATDVLTPLLNRELSSSALSLSSSPGSASIASYGDRSLSATHLLPPSLLNAPIAAAPIPFGALPSVAVAASIRAAAVDLGAGAEGVPTLIKWQHEDGQSVAANGKPAVGPAQVFVTGTFAKGWKTKVELKKNNVSDFSVLILLPPGPHRLKFIVDKEWKASRHLPAATDADGNLINYLHVKETAKSTPWSEWTSGSPAKSTIPLGSSPSGVPSPWTTIEEDGDDGWGAAEDTEWTSEIPGELLEWGEWEAEREAAEIAAETSGVMSPPLPPPTNGVPPPSLPAQLEKGPLNHAAYVTQGSGDDNSILPKPDHSVINHLAASPIKGGFLSVGVTTRYKRKFVTVVYYKALNA